MPDRVAALVLAAGSASRFGDTKQLARLEGRPLVAHVVARARAAGLAPVVVVVGHEADAVAAAVEDGAEVVVNPDHEQGQSTSLRAGVEALESGDADAMVVLLADEPRVSPAAVRAVVAALASGAEVARAVYEDRPGHPVGFARSVWPDLLAAKGDRGARRVLGGLDVVPVRVAGAAPTDVDTPRDLEELR